MDAQSAAGAAVLDALTRACSQHADILTPAVAQLQAWEKQPGFYSILASVFHSQDVEISVRWLAVLYFKNGIDRYWRKNAPSAISEDEKETLRQRLLSDFREPVNQIATQQSVLIGKISRLDCPKYWPSLVPTLIAAVRAEDPLTRRRATLTFYHVIKSLASRRLAADRKIFEALTLEIFDFVVTMWDVINTQRQTTNTIEDESLLYLKVLRQLLVFGFNNIHDHPSVVSVLEHVFQQIDIVYNLAGKYISDLRDVIGVFKIIGYNDVVDRYSEASQRREKMLNLLMKLLLDVQTYHPAGFVLFLRSSFQLVITYNCSHNHSVVDERFHVHVFNLMRNILRCETYKPTKCIEETRSAVALQAHKIRTEFFTVDLLTALCRHLVLDYLTIKQDELIGWDSDPENFLSDDSGGESIKFSLRPCAETVCTTLVKEFRDVCTPVLIQLLHEYQHTIDSNDLTAILQKDAVYHAVGLTSFDLCDLINFDDWFTTSLCPDLSNPHANYRVLRRRAVWLIGAWVGVKCTMREQLYDTLALLVARCEDLVVRLEAARTLKICIDDVDFQTEQFLPFLERIFNRLFELLQDVKECDSKLTVLHTMSFIIERMQTDIRPYAGALIQHLPQLWDSSAQHELLQAAIITTLAGLVQSLGSLSADMYEILIPVIRYSTDIQQSPNVYLYVDGLELWLVTLHSSLHSPSPLLQLFDNMFPLLELGSETLTSCLGIIEAYTLLNTREFLATYSTRLSAALLSVLSDVNTDGTLLVHNVIEKMLCLSSEDAAQMFAQVLYSVFRAVLNDEEQSPMLIASHLMLCSRVILFCPGLFTSFVERLAAEDGGCTCESMLELFLSRWLDQSDMVVQLERKKLNSLALCSLFSSTNRAVLNVWSGLINNCVETLHDVCTSGSEEMGATRIDTLVKNSDKLSDECFTANDQRLQQLSQKDPVYSVSLRDYLVAQLTELQAQLGTATFNELMKTVDCEIYQQLQQFIN